MDTTRPHHHHHHLLLQNHQQDHNQQQQQPDSTPPCLTQDPPLKCAVCAARPVWPSRHCHLHKCGSVGCQFPRTDRGDKRHLCAPCRDSFTVNMALVLQQFDPRTAPAQPWSGGKMPDQPSSDYLGPVVPSRTSLDPHLSGPFGPSVPPKLTTVEPRPAGPINPGCARCGGYIAYVGPSGVKVQCNECKALPGFAPHP